MRCTCSVAVLLVLPGCDALFRLNVVPPPDDAAPDGPPDAAIDAIDAPPILECTSSPVIVRANGDSEISWTSQVPTSGTHADKISEAVADDDASYIATPSDGQFDLFTHETVADTMQIDSVTFYVRARIEAASAMFAAAPAFKSGASVQWDDRMITTSWSDVASDVYVNDPATAMPWTVPGLNATAIGVRKSYNTDPVRVTQVWASVACH